MVLKEGAASVTSARSRSPPQVKDVAKASWEVKHVPGKGMGMFATGHIKMGEVIIREEALINMPDAVYQWEDMDRIERWLDRKINNLTSNDRAAFFDLADSRACDEDDGKTTLGIFFTNAMNFFGDAALFPKLARANHSCTPNSDFVGRKKPLVQDIVATRDILPEEEITLSYLPACGEGSDVREVRQAYLREWYGFRCCCKVCCLQDDELAADDKMRLSARSLMLKDAAGELTCSAELEKLSDLLTLIGCKLPYRMEVSGRMFRAALEEGRMEVAAKAMADSWIMESVLLEEDNEEESEWKHVAKSQFVWIGGSLYTMFV